MPALVLLGRVRAARKGVAILSFACPARRGYQEADSFAADGQ